MTWRSRTGQRASTSAGFTLIEILVVLVILGLALSIVAGFVPTGHATRDLASGTDTLANTLRLARARAIARQQPVLFSITAGGHGYAVDGVAHALPPALTAAMAGAPVIRFAADGSSSGGAIRLAAGGQMRSLRVDWLTGRVSSGTGP